MRSPATQLIFVRLPLGFPVAATKERHPLPRGSGCRKDRRQFPDRQQFEAAERGDCYNFVPGQAVGQPEIEIKEPGAGASAKPRRSAGVKDLGRNEGKPVSGSSAHFFLRLLADSSGTRSAPRPARVAANKTESPQCGPVQARPGTTTLCRGRLWDGRHGQRDAGARLQLAPELLQLQKKLVQVERRPT